MPFLTTCSYAWWCCQGKKSVKLPRQGLIFFLLLRKAWILTETDPNQKGAIGWGLRVWFGLYSYQNNNSTETRTDILRWKMCVISIWVLNTQEISGKGLLEIWDFLAFQWKWTDLTINLFCYCWWCVVHLPSQCLETLRKWFSLSILWT